MKRTFLGWTLSSKMREKTKGGMLFVDGELFANVFLQHADFGGGWILNRDFKAFELGFDNFPGCFESPQALQNYVDNWLETK